MNKIPYGDSIMKNILTLNKIAACGTDRFDKSVYECGDNVENPVAIMVRSASMHDMEIDKSVIAVARAGAGTNNIPIEKYTEEGICVFNTPGANANAVCELVICGLLMSSRKIAEALDWCKTLKGHGETVGKEVEKGKSAFAGPEILGKTLGIIGYGAIGKKVANVAAALGMSVLAYDSFGNPQSDDARIKIVDSVDEIYAESDYISLHMPLNDSTKNTICNETLAKMKDGVRILNFARGGLVKSDDMIVAIENGKVAAYVVDFPSDEMIDVKGVIAIPHLGASTPESEDNCAVMAANQLISYIEKGEIINSVNLPRVELGEVKDVRTCVIHDASATEEVKKALGAEFVTAQRGNIAYTVADVKANEEALKAIAGVKSVRVIG